MGGTLAQRVNRRVWASVWAGWLIQCLARCLFRHQNTEPRIQICTYNFSPVKKLAIGYWYHRYKIETHLLPQILHQN